MVAIRLQGIEKFGILAAQLKGPAGKQMRKELSKALRTAVKPAVAEVKATVRTLPVTTTSAGTHGARARGTKRTAERGLRAAIAAGVYTKIDYGNPNIRIVVQASLPADQAKLPRYLNDPKGWRHPVFGNRDAWVTQRGKPYFEPPILRQRTAIVAELVKALDATAETIARSVRGG